MACKVQYCDKNEINIFPLRKRFRSAIAAVKSLNRFYRQIQTLRYMYQLREAGRFALKLSRILVPYANKSRQALLTSEEYKRRMAEEARRKEEARLAALRKQEEEERARREKKEARRRVNKTRDLFFEDLKSILNRQEKKQRNYSKVNEIWQKIKENKLKLKLKIYLKNLKLLRIKGLEKC